jgi:hypothetical protein
MSKKVVYLIFSILVIYSCSSKKEQNVEIISMDDLMGDSTEQPSIIVEEKQDSVPILSTKIEKLLYALKPDYDTTFTNKSHVFDRFGFNTSYKLQFIGKNKVPYGKSIMVTPKANFFVYNFSDSVKLNNAFYNWLDCFGSDCQAVKLKEDIKAVKTPPSFTLVYDTTIVILEYPCEHEKNNWKAFKDSIVKKYGYNYRYRIDVDCGGPLKWK